MQCSYQTPRLPASSSTTHPGTARCQHVAIRHLNLPATRLTSSSLRGGPASVRRFLPELIELVCNRKIDPGKVFDLTLPLDQVAEGYQAMDERRAIKALLRP